MTTTPTVRTDQGYYVACATLSSFMRSSDVAEVIKAVGLPMPVNMFVVNNEKRAQLPYEVLLPPYQLWIDYHG